MTPITFLGKRYYIVHNGDNTKDEATCEGCAFQMVKYHDCPNGYSNSPLLHQCDHDSRIYIPRTKKALAEWVAWKLDGFPIDVTTEDKP